MPLNDHTKLTAPAPLTPLFRLRKRQSLACTGCFLAALFFLHPAAAQEESTAYLSPRNPANDYLNAIDEMEADHGPYATELSDLYLGLGQTLMENGDYEQARDALHRGVMVERVNSGPNSPEQTNHLYMVANIETLLGDLKAADEVLHNIYFINSNYHGEDSPKMLPVLERMHQWYLTTRPPGSTTVEYSDFERNIELTEEWVRISEEAKGENHPDTAVGYRRLAEAHFQLVHFLTGTGMVMTPQSFTAATNGSLFPALGFGSELVAKHANAGRKAFTSYLQSMLANESTTALEYAEALADLGDWFLVFEKHRRSWVLYKQSYQILAQSKAYAELADDYMSHPKPMHFVNDLHPDFLEGATAELRDLRIDISMTVTALGAVRNIEFLEAPEGFTEDDLKAIKRQLMLIPFRPAMKQGEVVTTKDFIWHYAITPQGTAS